MANSNAAQRAQAFGITYRSEDYRFAVILNGDSAIVVMNDGMGWSDEATTDIESAWNMIARRSLKLVSSY